VVLNLLTIDIDFTILFIKRENKFLIILEHLLQIVEKMHYTYKYVGKEIIIAFENLKRSYKKVTEKSQNNSIIFSDGDNTLNQRVDVRQYISGRTHTHHKF
jgi:ABC-type glutathione transport system ATPase component